MDAECQLAALVKTWSASSTRSGLCSMAIRTASRPLCTVGTRYRSADKLMRSAPSLASDSHRSRALGASGKGE